jgi:hypothetical protein
VDNSHNQHNKALQMSNMDMLTEAWFVPDMLRAPLLDAVCRWMLSLIDIHVPVDSAPPFTSKGV